LLQWKNKTRIVSHVRYLLKVKENKHKF
jgi:hypothetical protein